MSEYQYFEFIAIDRPLDRAAREALRAMSSRARITATHFVNHYNWGDFRGDPRALMERWFDLHLYLANWGTRRLMIRVPGRLLDRAVIAPVLHRVDGLQLWEAGDDVIIDFCRELEQPPAERDDDSDWLADLLPLRADMLSGDLRLFYLMWLVAVEDGLIADDEFEPLPGIGPLGVGFETFAEFFGIDRDLVQAAAKSGADGTVFSGEALRKRLAAVPEEEKTELLARLAEGDGQVVAELLGRMRGGPESRTSAPARTVGALRALAQQAGTERERAEGALRERERQRQAAEAESARRVRIRALRQRGAGVWREIERQIARRNASGYDQAAGLLADLQVLAAEDGSQIEFARRLTAIRLRHADKARFIERLARLAPH